MKLLSLLVSVLIVSVCGAQEIDLRRHIEVSGRSRISADVDLASWQIRIRGEAATLPEAAGILDRATTALQDRLREAGLDESALRLSGIASGRDYEKSGDSRVFKGYYAERAAVIRISDLSGRQVLETALLADDRVEIVNIDLRSSKHEELRKQALLAAVAAARDKAAFLAAEAGAELGPLLAVREGETGNGWIALNDNRIAQPPFAQNGTAEFDKLDFTATVTVKFELK